MTKLQWGEVGTRLYEAGVDRGVLYIDSVGVPWSGLVSVADKSDGDDVSRHYIDGFNYLNVAIVGEFKATIQAFYSPQEFDACDGVEVLSNGLMATQQPRKQFGFSYRSKVGNDLDGNNHGYKVHLVYNALANPAQTTHNTLTENDNITPLSWDIVTNPLVVANLSKPTAHLVIDTTETSPWVIKNLEDILYGTDITPPRMPTPEELVTLFNSLLPEEYTNFDNGYIEAKFVNTDDQNDGYIYVEWDVDDTDDGYMTIVNLTGAVVAGYLSTPWSKTDLTNGYSDLSVPSSVNTNNGYSTLT